MQENLKDVKHTKIYIIINILVHSNSEKLLYCSFNKNTKYSNIKRHFQTFFLLNFQIIITTYCVVLFGNGVKFSRIISFHNVKK